MNLKIILIILSLIGIIIISLFSFGVKEVALKGMVGDVAEYNCGSDGLCTSCIIGGNTCSCGKHECECGNMTVDRSECTLYR